MTARQTGAQIGPPCPSSTKGAGRCSQREEGSRAPGTTDTGEPTVDADAVNQSHLTENQVVAYLGHELTDEPLRRVEQHLAQCSQCREEIVEAREILGRPRPRRSRWPVLAPIAAAAAIVLVIFWPGNPDPQPGDQQPRGHKGHGAALPLRRSVAPSLRRFFLIPPCSA